MCVFYLLFKIYVLLEIYVFSIVVVKFYFKVIYVVIYEYFLICKMFNFLNDII